MVGRAAASVAVRMPAPWENRRAKGSAGRVWSTCWRSFDRESEQYLCAALLRHGKAVASGGTVGLLSRLLSVLRRAFPRARLLVRLDGGFASPAVFDFLEAQPRLDYVVAMAKNAVLLRHAEPAMLVAQARSWRSEQTEHVYTETDEYQAGEWSRARRVVIKAEVVRLGDREPRDNPRFVVTNLRQTPRFIYEKVYCARGDVENRIKELKGPADRPHELPQVLTEPVARPSDGRRLRADAGVAVARRRHRVRQAEIRSPVGVPRNRGNAVEESFPPAPAGQWNPSSTAICTNRGRGRREPQKLADRQPRPEQGTSPWSPVPPRSG